MPFYFLFVLRVAGKAKNAALKLINITPLRRKIYGCKGKYD